MALKRMDNVGIVADDLVATIEFFRELGLELEGQATIEGEWAERVTGLHPMHVEIAMRRSVVEWPWWRALHAALGAASRRLSAKLARRSSGVPTMNRSRASSSSGRSNVWSAGTARSWPQSEYTAYLRLR